MRKQATKKLINQAITKQSGKLVLASASPRRALLLREAGYQFEVVVSPVEEPQRKPRNISLEHWPRALAYIKAYAVQQQLAKPNVTILGADTIVLLNGRVLGKPRDRVHASRMLRQLSGGTHQVITGIALLHGPYHRFAQAVSLCRIGHLSDDFLQQYLDSGLWQGKAGAYGIQDHDDPWVKLVAGEWSNVVGLPMGLLRQELKALVRIIKEKASCVSSPI